MTTVSFLTRAALATALVMIGLIVLSVRVSTAAQAAQQKNAAAKPATAAQVAANSEIWDVEGVVVDEQDRPVAGATVRTMPVFDGPANVAVKSGADGKFRFTLRPSPMSLVGLMAEADGGARMGLDSSFDRRRVERIKDPARIVLKQSKSMTVRVKDGTGRPVPGATVEAAEISFRTQAVTGADGLARLRIPTDAHVEWVIGFKPKAGLDCFDIDDRRTRTQFRLVPEEVTLTLGGTEGVRIKTIDSSGRLVPGVGFKPIMIQMVGKEGSVRGSLCATLSAVTDAMGVASFDWLPREVAVMRFAIDPGGEYSCPDSLAFDRGRPHELTARLLRLHATERDSAACRWPTGRAHPDQSQRIGPCRPSAGIGFDSDCR